jgi:hypothetical protein
VIRSGMGCYRWPPSAPLCPNLVPGSESTLSAPYPSPFAWWRTTARFHCQDEVAGSNPVVRSKALLRGYFGIAIDPGRASPASTGACSARSVDPYGRVGRLPATDAPIWAHPRQLGDGRSVTMFCALSRSAGSGSPGAAGHPDRYFRPTRVTSVPRVMRRQPPEEPGLSPTKRGEPVIGPNRALPRCGTLSSPPAVGWLLSVVGTSDPLGGRDASI